MRKRSSVKDVTDLINLVTAILCTIISATITIIFWILKLIKNFITFIILNLKSTDNIDYEEKLKHLNPREFEQFCCELFRQYGYKVELTQETNDYGRDIILKRDDKTIFVECKYYAEGNFVGREVCQKLLGSMYMFNADAAVIITTGTFHRNAIEVSNMVGNLQLIDTKGILSMIEKIERPQRLFLRVI